MRSSSLLVGALGYRFVASQATQTFLSRPDLRPPVLNFSIYDESQVTPGYILFTPFTAIPSSGLTSNSSSSSLQSEIIDFEYNAIQNAPYIFNTNGDMIYSGYGFGGGEYALDLKVIKINGSNYLTYFAGQDPLAGSRGAGMIMDDSYHIVNSMFSGNGRAANDLHEFTVLPDTGTAMNTIFEPTPYNLQPQGLKRPWGYVVQGVMQEVSMATGDVVFEWKALDHVNPMESHNPYNLTDPETNGTTPATAWDFFHLNSLDKFSNGDYLFSSRYMWALYRIDGETGQIKWQLGGKSNQFKFINFDKPFAFQHHARIVSEGTNGKITISIFDNASNGVKSVSNQSSSMIMDVDVQKKTVTLTNQYFFPEADLSPSQGSTQVLDNGNVFTCWGQLPRLSEFTKDGKCVMAASFAPIVDIYESYRAFKIDASDWVGKPDSVPAIWAYADSASSPVHIYASWNGATEIASWRFWGQTGANGKTKSLGTAKVQGFETSFNTTKFYPGTMAEALDAQGNSLGKSLLQKTFVVGQEVKPVS